MRGGAPSDRGTRARRRPLALAAVALALALGAGVATLAAAGDPGGGPPTAAAPREPVLTPAAVAAARRSRGERPPGGSKRSRGERPPAGSHPQVVRLEGAGAERERLPDPDRDAPSPGAPSDAEVRAELAEARRELRAFRVHLDRAAGLRTGPRARVLADGTAQAPEDAPDAVKRVIMAGNEIARFPYRWGGGHGAWRDTGYDCSGSVSFALAGAGLLDRPLTSGAFMRWDDDGAGDWITIYANEGHIFMVVAGLRFDTSGRGRAGTRWQEAPRSTAGFAVRHPAGL